MIIQGRIVDSNTKAPIVGVQIQGYTPGSTGSPSDTMIPGASDETDNLGQFYIDSPGLDEETAYVSAIDPSGNYGQVVGAPGFFQNDVLMDKLQQTSFQIPSWIYIVIVILIIIIGYRYYKKGKIL